MKRVKCGKSMKNPKTGSNHIGISIQFVCEDNSNREFLEKQSGKYELNKAYNFCFECWLDSLFLGKFGEAPNEI